MSRVAGIGPHEHIFPWESDLLYLPIPDFQPVLQFISINIGTGPHKTVAKPGTHHWFLGWS